VFKILRLVDTQVLRGSAAAAAGAGVGLYVSTAMQRRAPQPQKQQQQQQQQQCYGLMEMMDGLLGDAGMPDRHTDAQ